MRELNKSLWESDYCKELTFEVLRERFFPEFPKSIFHTRKCVSSANESGSHKTDWISSAGSFALRYKVFIISGGVEFRGLSDDDAWFVKLTSGEYTELPAGNYDYRYTSCEKSLFFRVIERPSKNSPLWKKAIQLNSKIE